MTPRERFVKVLNFEKPDDRLPKIEWTGFWEPTLERWKKEGAPESLTGWDDETFNYFDLDILNAIWGSPMGGVSPITGEKSYEEIRSNLWSVFNTLDLKGQAYGYKERHDKGDFSLNLRLDGYFCVPRYLFGIENHFYAFYDYPELMHRINSDLCEFNIRVVDEFCKYHLPDMVGIAEDMSYNSGPMLSYEHFKEFLLPYYQKLIPHIKKHGIKVFIDTDGDVHDMIPWLIEAGIDGIFPLERRAGVDINKIRKDYPEFLMLGGYDKMVMSQTEVEMRAEFERILPVMKSGGYIPSVDHSTPPAVSFENYKIYLKLYDEYTRLAVI